MKIAFKTFTALGLLAGVNAAQAIDFSNDTVTGNFDSTVSIGVGIRAHTPDCVGIIGSIGGVPVHASGSDAPAGCTEAYSGYGDQGNLNYRQGQLFTGYVKGTSELLLKFDNDIKFLGRVSWLRDLAADKVSGDISAAGSTSLPGDSGDQLREKIRLLDFWVSKSFNLADERAQIRVGNQVINWGESLFLPGGINQTNAEDLMRLSQPGTQLKEAVLPTKMINFSTGLGGGFSVESYVQLGWEGNYFPPVGSFWSTATVGPGADGDGFPTTKTPRSGGQYGVALRYTPDSISANFGLYALNYHDKSPVMSTSTTSPSGYQYSYLEDRKLLGASVNFPVGNWAIGSELSYRPKDAVSLNSSAPGLSTTTVGAQSCLANTHCYVESGKYQLAVTGLLSLTPSDYGGILNFLHADTGTLLSEAVVVRYPGLQSKYQGVPVAAGLWGWGYDNAANLIATGSGTPDGVGTATSYGINFDYSWVYDGTVIKGWQVVPEVYYFDALKGYTPNAMGTFMQGAKSANFVVTFLQNPATWQFAVNYAGFWGGRNILAQPLKDHGYVGMTLTRNF